MANNLQDIESAAPDISYTELQKITDNFSDDLKIGEGGSAKVYKGKYKDKEIAVKKLHRIEDLLDDKQFNTELFNLVRVQHPNIIKLVGFCCATKCELIKYEGRLSYVDVQERVLCFEYFPHGSLKKYLSVDSSELDWRKRYKIIVGICKGLNFLHNGSEIPVYHLDLKPANVLLDESWMPKICDFGLSRLISDSTKSHITKNCIGTKPFMPREYIDGGRISRKYDVFSLGVTMIQIIAGPEGYSMYHAMTPEEFTERVHMNWRRQIEGTSKHVEEYCQQVKECIKIALDCVEHDKEKRPDMKSIIHMLEHIETVTHITVADEKKGEQEQLEQIETVTHITVADEKKGEQEQLEQIETMIHRTVEKEGQQEQLEQIGTIIHRTVEEQKGEQEQEKSQVRKYGPWGGNGGTAHDMEAASSHRLRSVTLRHGDIIDSLAFSYSDHRGNEHFVGPWGGTNGADQYVIELQPSEYLKEISGRVGSYALSRSNVIRSLTLVTNQDSYTFGYSNWKDGTRFRIELESNWAIVGFFARAGKYVHQIGVYARPNRSSLDAEELAVSSELEGEHGSSSTV